MPGVRILLVSQLYPGPDDPDLGVFVRQLERELERLGHRVERAVLDRRAGGKARYARLAADAVAAARRVRPDVVYAHVLFPTGAIAAAAARVSGAALVVTAHGRDVRNVDAIPGVRAATRATVRRAQAVIAVSDFLRRELVAKLPELEGRVEVIDCGVDLSRFVGGDPAEARAALGWVGEPPFFLQVGALDPRKNPLRLAEAFGRLGGGRLAFVGDGSLRPRLEGRPGITVVGRVAHERVAEWIAACDVLCQASLVEPFGQALLEALASGRSVVATRIGGPPEFVVPGAGVLVDPASVDSIEQGLRAAAALPTPNLLAREAAAAHDVRVQAGRVAAVLERAVTARRSGY
jgi:glycosyltransferase involved in cell wall biosynthesis